MKISSVAAGLALLLCAGSSDNLRAKDDKIKPEELVARHLASIGTPEAIAAVRTRVMGGTAQVNFRLGGHGELRGKSGILSDQGKVRIGMTFPSLDYPGEQLGYDGSHVTTGWVRPGQRSTFSQFVYLHDMMLREGLLGGATTTAWALLNTAQRQPKLSYSGLKKLEGRQVHEVKYRAKGAGDLQIALFFDAETYRHVGSQYRLVQPASMQTSISESSGQRDTIYLVVERFDDFKQVDGLTLPHAYKVAYTLEGPVTVLQDWAVTIDQVTHNTPVDAKYFAVE